MKFPHIKQSHENLQCVGMMTHCWIERNAVYGHVGFSRQCWKVLGDNDNFNDVLHNSPLFRRVRVTEMHVSNKENMRPRRDVGGEPDYDNLHNDSTDSSDDEPIQYDERDRESECHPIVSVSGLVSLVKICKNLRCTLQSLQLILTHNNNNLCFSLLLVNTYTMYVFVSFHLHWNE